MNFEGIFPARLKEQILMSSLSDQIMEYAETLPQHSPLLPRKFFHMGSPSGVYKAFSSLTRQDRLMRIFKGIYVRTRETRFGRCGPDHMKVVKELSKLWGETIVPSEGGAANWLGLTDQVPMRLSFLTSGPSRILWFHAISVGLRHAPQWQLVAPYRPAGTLIRALTFLHPSEAEEAINKVIPEFSEEDVEELIALRSVLPEWIAKPLGAIVNNVR